MALPHKYYPPFMGIPAGKPQGYDCIHYRAPVYQCVFGVDDTVDAERLAEEVARYKQDPLLQTPTMCLVFRGRGVVWPDMFQNDWDLIAEIEFVKNLPKLIGDVNLTQWERMRSFMGSPAQRPDFMREKIVIYDIDTVLSGLQIAEEARIHYEHLRETHEIDKFVLRLPNSGSVMVHRYMTGGYTDLHLCTAIQRARQMELPGLVSAVAT